MAAAAPASAAHPAGAACVDSAKVRRRTLDPVGTVARGRAATTRPPAHPPTPRPHGRAGDSGARTVPSCAADAGAGPGGCFGGGCFGGGCFGGGAASAAFQTASTGGVVAGGRRRRTRRRHS